MLLPAQMTQGGGICSDSQRITYTPEGGSGQTLVHEMGCQEGESCQEGEQQARLCPYPLAHWKSQERLHHGCRAVPARFHVQSSEQWSLRCRV